MTPEKQKPDSLELVKTETPQFTAGRALFPGDQEGNRIAELEAKLNGLSIEIAENRGVDKGKQNAKAESRAKWQTAFNIITILMSLVALIVSIVAIVISKSQ